MTSTKKAGYTPNTPCRHCTSVYGAHGSISGICPGDDTFFAEQANYPGPMIAEAVNIRVADELVAVVFDPEEDGEHDYDPCRLAQLFAQSPLMVEALLGIIESATDGREIPEWLAERLKPVPSILLDAGVIDA